MFEFALSTLLSAKAYIRPDPYRPPEYIQSYCARQVGIPYASDNFTELEWSRFVSCIRKHNKIHEV